MLPETIDEFKATARDVILYDRPWWPRWFRLLLLRQLPEAKVFPRGRNTVLVLRSYPGCLGIDTFLYSCTLAGACAASWWPGWAGPICGPGGIPGGRPRPRRPGAGRPAVRPGLPHLELRRCAGRSVPGVAARTD